jgi:peptidoglycan/LPS O-acetylase OafA/YrhL
VLVGVITGYVMFDKSLCNEVAAKFKQREWLVVLCWISSISFLWYAGSHDPYIRVPGLASGVYDAIHKDLFACSICWMVFACHCLDSGGIIKRFLSHPAWQPLSKLNFSIYLVHQPYLHYTDHYYKRVHHFVWHWHLWFGDIVMSLIFAAFFHVVIEAPLGHIISMIMNSMSFKKEEKKSKDDSRDKVVLCKIED